MKGDIMPTSESITKSTITRQEPIWENMPNELKQFPNWVCWYVAERNGKPTKPPVNPKTLRLAKVEDPQTWATFDQAKEAFSNNLRIFGVGFVITKELGITGVDFDGCFEDGEMVWGKEDIQTLNTYTEISPSGNGLHILAFGNKPGKSSKKGKVEMYCESRYLTVTGRHLENTPKNIENRQEQINSLYQKYFAAQTQPLVNSPMPALPNLDHCQILDKAMKAKNSAKFKALWQGNWQGYYKSQSEAELALCSMLAFWTQHDHAQIDSLFRSSALYRSKWDKKHGEQTYGQMTIQTALRSTTAIYDQHYHKREDTASTPQSQTMPLEPAPTKQPTQFKTVIKTISGEIRGKFVSYYLTEKGIYLEKVETKKGSKEITIVYEKICDDSVEITERLDDIAGDECFVKLAWNGKEKIVPIAYLLPKNLEELVNSGIRILSPNAAAMNEYFLIAMGGEAAKTKTYSIRNGWTSGKFVLGDKLVSDKGIEEISRSSNAMMVGTGGTREAWRNNVHRFCNDPQVQIVLGASAAAPLLYLLKVEGFTLHLYQESSLGKSFLQKIAASYWGRYEDDNGRGLLKNWNGTAVGHEVNFHQLKNIPCLLEESQLVVDKKILETVIYQFANGYGKVRGNKKVESDKLKNWHSVLISSGEAKITDITNFNGLAARIVEILRKKHEEIKESEFRKAILSMNKNYGWGGLELIQFIIAHKDELEAAFVNLLEQIESAITLKNEQKRLIPRWAAIFLGAEINNKLFGFNYDKEAIWKEMLATLGEMNAKTSDRLYETIVEMFYTNPSHFHRRGKTTGNEYAPDSKGGEELWGFFDETENRLNFYPTVLKRELERRGFTWSQLVILREQGKLVSSDDQKRLTRQIMWKKIRTYFISFVLTDLASEEASEIKSDSQS